MIISASRRTDIPAFHAEWMMNRLREGFAYVRNPFNARQIIRVSLRRPDAEAIVFWTKDASNLLAHLDELDDMGHRYLFQYTLTPYGQDIERQVDKPRAMNAFLHLASRIGPERVVWRYDPILFAGDWDAERHLRLFEKMCIRLEGATGRCVISFVDLYAALRRTAPFIQAPNESEMRMMAREISRIARARHILPSACAEALDLTGEGLDPRGCIDRLDIEALLGAKTAVRRDSTQRSACRCIKSVDIGAYDTCRHGCLYCYAMPGRKSPAPFDPLSPILGSPLCEGDRITDRQEKRIAPEQVSFLD